MTPCSLVVEYKHFGKPILENAVCIFLRSRQPHTTPHYKCVTITLETQTWITWISTNYHKNLISRSRVVILGHTDGHTFSVWLRTSKNAHMANRTRSKDRRLSATRWTVRISKRHVLVLKFQDRQAPLAFAVSALHQKRGRITIWQTDGYNVWAERHYTPDWKLYT
jgi:hypothetical protein